MTGILLRALVVDDEPNARINLRLMLAEHADVEIAGECADGDEALAAIEQQAPDVVFLDWSMPGRDGLAVAKEVARLPAERQPLIVFVTAHGEHALRAFEVAAVDFVLKPPTAQRLRDSLDRVRRWKGSGAKADLTTQIADLRRHLGQSARLSFDSPAGAIIVAPEEIIRVDLRDGQVHLHTGQRAYSVSSTLDAVEGRLESLGFVRVHRSAIVNLREVREVQGTARHEGTILMKDGSLVPLSRRRRALLLERLADTH